MATNGATVLIVDDDRFVRMALSEALGEWGYDVTESGDLKTARTALATDVFGIVLLDIDLPDGSGLDLLPEIVTSSPDTIVVVITGNADVEHAVAALRGGAHDFIGKPLRIEELRVTLRNATETGELRKEVKRVRNAARDLSGFDAIIGDSLAMVSTKELALRVARSDVSSILLNGETGTGKDLFARAIHFNSDRHDRSYLAINCAALPANLIESELFGYEKGAFTDAKQRKEGLLEQAGGGTIFLDEIGEMELGLQAKLLRVLEDNSFRRVGGLRDIKFDARIVAASNRDLRSESEAGNFRLDLYFRLSIIQIDIPPLRERGDDIVRLAEFYIDRANHKRTDRKLIGLSDDVDRIFRRYKWSGNVRELRNVIERASILEDGQYITATHLPADMLDKSQASDSVTGSFRLPKGGIDLEKLEYDLAVQAFELTNGNMTRAAALLNLNRDQLRYKLRKGGFDGLRSSSTGK